MSGGQRSRLGLAALLIRQPETLLLDEPTNHLDDAAMEFLERHLTELTGIVVLSSHDRVFLDAVCTDIVDLDPAAADRRPAVRSATAAATPTTSGTRRPSARVGSSGSPKNRRS